MNELKNMIAALSSEISRHREQMKTLEDQTASSTTRAVSITSDIYLDT